VSGPPRLLGISSCESCHSRFLPRAGPCPHCGGTRLATGEVPPEGRVLASTESLNPPAGWSGPLRLALVQLAEDVRCLALVVGELPGPGDPVVVSKSAERYEARALGTPADGPARS
jgi:uncharacterized OB-fold protein